MKDFENAAIIIMAVAWTGRLAIEFAERRKAAKRYRAYEERCRARLIAMYAERRDPYDGRPV